MNKTYLLPINYPTTTKSYVNSLPVTLVKYVNQIVTIAKFSTTNILYIAIPQIIVSTHLTNLSTFIRDQKSMYIYFVLRSF
jgi:hypothetical protein